MAWTNKKGFNFRQTIAFAADNAGELGIPEDTGGSLNITTYKSYGPLDGDTFNLGFSVGGATDGARNRSANVPSSSDHRLAGIQANLGNTAGATLKIQAGIAAGQYKVWAAFGDASNASSGTITFVLRDSNGTFLTKSGLAATSAGQFYDINGTLYTSGANWAAAADGAGTAFTFTTTDTTNGNGGPFIFLDIGNGTQATPLSHFAVQYLGSGAAAPILMGGICL